jgi:crotonobetainyl-CoA:carnitine CoA-transferase CaiB-like acyl-CoA transferase
VIGRLAEWADVVIESFTPKTLRGWGLDYEHLRARNPGLVMLSTCMQGQTGPRANYRGFGNLMGALSGYYHVTGWPDRGPSPVYGAYTDFICQRFCTTVLVAAIDHRCRTGEGQHIDVAQFEAALQFLGPELVDAAATGSVATRAGNRDPWAAPHGVFPCAARPDGNEGWIAIACETDAEWAALCRRAGFGDEPAFATLAGRKADEDRLEAMVGAWTAQHDATELFELLQPDVPCGPVLPVPALQDDPQVQHRGYWWPLVHTVMGEVPYDGLAATMSRTPGRLTKAGPCLGEDTFTVLTEIAGYEPDAVARLLADDVVEITG